MSFLKKLFGFGNSGRADIEDLIEETLDGLIEKADLDLTFDIHEDDNLFTVELSGEDAELVKAKDGQLLDAFQFFVKRVVQHSHSEERINVIFDCDGYREEADNALIELAEKLKGIALDKNKSVYFRALPPRDRRIVHQHLAKDERVKSKSIGDGLYKKIKVFPINLKKKAQAQAATN